MTVGRRYPIEWLELYDPESKKCWMIDISFMLSTYKCIFGEGCKGAWGCTAEGCCHTSPYFDESLSDLERVSKYVKELSPDHTDNYKEIRKRWLVKDQDGSLRARKKDGFCIFFNRGATDGSVGCALHSEALRRGEDWHDWKPDICSQFPFSVEEEDEVFILTAWQPTLDGWWDKEQKKDYDPSYWWCVADEEAYSKTRTRVYATFCDELKRIMGLGLYRQLVHYCDGKLLTETKNEKKKRSLPVQAVKGNTYAGAYESRYLS